MKKVITGKEKIKHLNGHGVVLAIVNVFMTILLLVPATILRDKGLYIFSTLFLSLALLTLVLIAIDLSSTLRLIGRK